jgi:polyribonucleotide nucleotidyltransferase
MECVAPHKSEIIKTFMNIRDFSYKEKKSPILEEERINSFLDTLNDFKNDLKEKTLKIYEINEKIEEITWFNDLDEECLMKLNDIISSAKDLRSSLVRQYISMNFLRKRGVAKEVIREFKFSIDELKESYEDLESVFFFLPEMPEFKEITKKLSLI